jgi:hypothetical protein
MCDNCESSLNNEELDAEDIALMSLGILGGLLEAYVGEEYADPMMYKALGLGARLCDKLGAEEMAERFRFVQIQAGELVNQIIDERNLPIQKDEWS